MLGLCSHCVLAYLGAAIFVDRRDTVMGIQIPVMGVPILDSFFSGWCD